MNKTKVEIPKLKAQASGVSQITIETNSGAKVTMNFTDAHMARSEYQRIYSLGIYCNEWIKLINYKENVV